VTSNDTATSISQYQSFTPTRRLRKSRRVTYMLNGWLEPIWLDSQAGGTTCLAIGCPDDFVAVRVGFANINETPWRLTKMSGRASSSFSDYVNPTGSAPWVYFTCRDGGLDSERVRAPENHSSEIIVSPVPFGTSSDADTPPRWTWTDWAPIGSLAPDTQCGLRVLMLRALVPSEQTVCYSVGQLRSLLGNKAINSGFECFIGGLKFDMDRVSTPDGIESTQTWIDNQLTVGSMFPAVQFLTKNSGITALLVGDSHQQGTSTTEQVTNFLYRAVTSAIPGHLGSIPLGFVNAAQGGLTSSQFFARMAALLDPVRPSFVVLPGWTYNDATGDVHGDQMAMSLFFAKLLAASEMCETRGIVPVFTTPFPRDSEHMGSVQLKPWLWLRHQILSLSKTGSIVLDTSELLSRRNSGGLEGTYRLEYSTDGAHPDDAGHSRIAETFKKFYG
jgi:hypothetical protein